MWGYCDSGAYGAGCADVGHKVVGHTAAAFQVESSVRKVVAGVLLFGDFHIDSAEHTQPWVFSCVIVSKQECRTRGNQCEGAWENTSQRVILEQVFPIIPKKRNACPAYISNANRPTIELSIVSPVELTIAARFSIARATTQVEESISPPSL